MNGYLYLQILIVNKIFLSEKNIITSHHLTVILIEIEYLKFILIKEVRIMESISFKELEFILLIFQFAEKNHYKFSFCNGSIEVTYPIDFFNQKATIINIEDLKEFCIKVLKEDL